MDGIYDTRMRSKVRWRQTFSPPVIMVSDSHSVLGLLCQELPSPAHHVLW